MGATVYSWNMCRITSPANDIHIIPLHHTISSSISSSHCSDNNTGIDSGTCVGNAGVDCGVTCNDVNKLCKEEINTESDLVILGLSPHPTRELKSDSQSDVAMPESTHSSNVAKDNGMVTILIPGHFPCGMDLCELWGGDAIAKPYKKEEASEACHMRRENEDEDAGGNEVNVTITSDQNDETKDRHTSGEIHDAKTANSTQIPHSERGGGGGGGDKHVCTACTTSAGSNSNSNNIRDDVKNSSYSRMISSRISNARYMSTSMLMMQQSKYSYIEQSAIIRSKIESSISLSPNSSSIVKDKVASNSQSMHSISHHTVPVDNQSDVDVEKSAMKPPLQRSLRGEMSMSFSAIRPLHASYLSDLPALSTSSNIESFEPSTYNKSISDISSMLESFPVTIAEDFDCEEEFDPIDSDKHEVGPSTCDKKSVEWENLDMSTSDYHNWWKRMIPNYLQSKQEYVLSWEPKVLNALYEKQKKLYFHKSISLLIGSLLSYTSCITSTAYALLGQLVLPISLLKLINDTDNPWLSAMSKAKETGVMLGNLLLNNHKTSEESKDCNPSSYTLIAYGMGCEVLYHALLTIAESNVRNNFKIIYNVVFIGAPIAKNVKELNAIRKIVSNRMVNCYSTNDWFLALMCTYQNWDMSVIGLKPVYLTNEKSENIRLKESLINHNDPQSHTTHTVHTAIGGQNDDVNDCEYDIDNINITDLIGSHLEYGSSLSLILNRVFNEVL